MSGAVAVAVGVALAVAPAVARAGDVAWRRAGERDGILVEQRGIEGSSLLEVRASGRSSAPPHAVMETVWRQREYVEFVPYLKRLDVLAEGADWKLVYEQVAMPLVPDRDYTIRLRRAAFPEEGRFAVTFASVPAEGPPESAGHVRARSIAGGWAIEPHPDGGTRASYTVRTDPGGTIPAWVVNRLQVRVAARFVRAVFERTEARMRSTVP